MSARIIDGTAIAKEIRGNIGRDVATLRVDHGPVPGLATVLVGDNPASQTYVRMKQRACEEVGIQSFGHTLPADATQEEVEALVNQLSDDPRVHGILVQLPLPKHLNEEAILGAVALDKDVDGFHPINIGRLTMKHREPLFIPCTPHGVMVLLEKAGARFKAGADDACLDIFIR